VGFPSFDYEVHGGSRKEQAEMQLNAHTEWGRLCEVAVEESQQGLMRALARYGIESLPVRLRHMRTLGGGPHCVTLDLVRDGELEDYA
jgi:N-dimethylarginine dimethylaminohydrolase